MVRLLEGFITDWRINRDWTEVIEDWKSNRNNYYYFNQWAKGFLYMIFYSSATQLRREYPNDKTDMEHLTYNLKTDIFVCNETNNNKFMLNALKALHPSKRILTSETFIGYLATL